LQGGEGPASEVADQWRPACTLGCTIVVPGRGQFINSDRDARNWFDEHETDARVADAVRLSPMSAPLLLAGFSAGGREAIRISAAGSPVTPAGALLFGPGKPRSKLDLAAAKVRGLRVWTFVGEDDWMLHDVLDLDRWIREAGIPLVEDRVPGMGHVVPDDLAERLPEMLDAVLPARGSA
jgi:dienelactone hydrolase